ncbi:Hypothetical protein, putative [Bodo saltans]|uniref:Uncharacterized protein n=1 Tax=Bodo saltans TaxID=75058 RepID=A0A0S4J1C0_BODSA|nr:Hypothetical protein, putative [Bodo saltans]|eukprot:CUG54941.1 Hypothetical protein, putative [Bodo saltans]
MGCQNSTLKQAQPAVVTIDKKPEVPVLEKPIETAVTTEVVAPLDETLAQPHLEKEFEVVQQEEPSCVAEEEPASVPIVEEVVVVKAAASPVRVAFGERAANKPTEQAVQIDQAPALSFSEYLNTENTVASTQIKRKVIFDAETMRKSAPKSIAPANLTKKQKEMLKRSHVSVGRRGPVASKWGGKSQMQTDVYLEMASAFERLLTNADTINAHLDSR